MFPASLRARRPALGSLALVLALLGTAAAEGATAVSVDPWWTWGTAEAGGGRAQLVLAVAEAGARVYLGGEFTRMVDPDSGARQARNRLAAIDVASGALTSWNPGADGTVRAMALSPDGTRLYVGGSFNRIDGQTAGRVALLNLATGRVDTRFHADVGGRVRGLALSGGRLYVGGEFDSVEGVPRPKVAALDATTGDLLDWAPPKLGRGRYTGQTGKATPDAAPGNVYDVAVSRDGTTVYAGGNFLDFAGQGGLVAFSAVSGQPLSRQWKVDRPVHDLDIWPADGRTLFAATGGPGGSLYAFRPDSSKPLWTARFDGDAEGVAASRTTVYVVGHYDFVVNRSSDCYRYCPKGSPRRHLAAFGAGTGVLDPWNPTADTSTGPYEVAVGANDLYVAGEFSLINGFYQPGFADFGGRP